MAKIEGVYVDGKLALPQQVLTWPIDWGYMDGALGGLPGKEVMLYEQIDEATADDSDFIRSRTF